MARGRSFCYKPLRGATRGREGFREFPGKAPRGAGLAWGGSLGRSDQEGTESVCRDTGSRDAEQYCRVVRSPRGPRAFKCCPRPRAARGESARAPGAWPGSSYCASDRPWAGSAPGSNPSLLLIFQTEEQQTRGDSPESTRRRGWDRAARLLDVPPPCPSAPLRLSLGGRRVRFRGHGPCVAGLASLRLTPERLCAL